MSTAQEIKKIVCGQCYTVLDVGDNFCRQCGAVTGNGPTGKAPTGKAPTGKAPTGKAPTGTLGTSGCVGSATGLSTTGPSRGGLQPGWSESPAFVLASLFLLLGPLALPMLWRSSRFSAAWKITLTIVVVVVTVAMLWLIWYLAIEVLRPLRDLQRF